MIVREEFGILRTLFSAIKKSLSRKQKEGRVISKFVLQSLCLGLVILASHITGETHLSFHHPQVPRNARLRMSFMRMAEKILLQF